MCKLYTSHKDCTQTPNGDISDESAIILPGTLGTWKPRPAKAPNYQLHNGNTYLHLRKMIKVQMITFL